MHIVTPTCAGSDDLDLSAWVVTIGRQECAAVRFEVVTADGASGPETPTATSVVSRDDRSKDRGTRRFAGSIGSRARNLARRLVGRFERSLPFRCLARFSAVDGKTRALVIAGQAFTSLVPLFILVASFGTHTANHSAIADSLVRLFHLTGGAAQAVRTLFTRPPGSAGTLGLASFVVLLFSLLTLTRAFQGAYESAWGFRPRGFRGTLSGLTGTGLIVAEVIVLTLLASALRGAPAATIVTVITRFIVSLILWLVLQWLLLSRRVAWRTLRPAALVAAVGQLLLSWLSAIYMPHLIARDASRYGIIGVTLALVSWLIVIGFYVVAVAVIGAELAGAPTLDSPPASEPDPVADDV